MIPEFSDAGVSQASIRLLSGYYQAASEKIKGWILKPPGGTAASQEWRVARASSLLPQVDAVVMHLKGAASGWVGKAMPAAMKDGIAKANKQAVEAGVRVQGSGIEGSFGGIDHRTAIILARDAAGDLFKAADSMAARAKSVLRQTAQKGLSESKINEILAGGVIEGEPAATTRALREELRAVHGDTVTIISKNGNPIEFKVGKYAELVAVTKTREATVTARHQRLEEQGMDLAAIVGRISTNFCTAFLGQVFSLSGKSSKYPAYGSLPGGGPPFHPRCSKSTRPYVEELATAHQEKQAEILPDSARLLGMDQTAAQRAFKDLQLHAQVKERYATTEKKLFG